MNTSMRRWLRLDALNRAWRAVLQGIVLTVLGAAGSAGLQVYQTALASASGGVAVDWGRVGHTAQYAALAAAGLAMLSYLHRRYLDPSRVPSGQPPAPPSVPVATAEAGAMRAGPAGRS